MTALPGAPDDGEGSHRLLVVTEYALLRHKPERCSFEVGAHLPPNVMSLSSLLEPEEKKAEQDVLKLRASPPSLSLANTNSELAMSRSCEPQFYQLRALPFDREIGEN